MFYGPRKVIIEELERPAPQEGEIIVKVAASNICGTDLRAWQRGHTLMKPPIVIGHEYSGIVDELGKHVSKFEVGDRIVGSNSSPCMTCAMCRAGSLTLCEKIPENLLGFSLPGSYAEYCRIPAHIVNRNVYRIPRNISPEEIACSEPLAAVIHALDKVSIKKGQTKAAIVGGGATGLMFLQLLKERGAYVVLIDANPERIKMAESFGSDSSIQVRDQDGLAAVLKQATKGEGPDIVVEATGTKESWENSFRSVRDGGQVLLFGGCAKGTTVAFDAGKLHYREISMVGSFHHEPSSFKRAIEAISERKVRVKELISSRLPLTKINEALRLMEKKEALKVAVMP